MYFYAIRENKILGKFQNLQYLENEGPGQHVHLRKMRWCFKYNYRYYEVLSNDQVKNIKLLNML